MILCQLKKIKEKILLFDLLYLNSTIFWFIKQYINFLILLLKFQIKIKRFFTFLNSFLKNK